MFAFLPLLLLLSEQARAAAIFGYGSDVSVSLVRNVIFDVRRQRSPLSTHS